MTRLMDEFSLRGMPLAFKPGTTPNLQPRDHIRPTDTAPILRPVSVDDPAAGLDLAEIRWWLIPHFHKRGIKDWKPICTNARAETVATTPAFRESFKRRRCLVPASHYFEWTGAKGAKTMWKFTKAQADFFCFAGLWDRASTSDGIIESFAILTCAAGPDCAPYHTRQPVLLEPDEWAPWLDLARDPTPWLVARAAGCLRVEPVAA